MFPKSHKNFEELLALIPKQSLAYRSDRNCIGKLSTNRAHPVLHLLISQDTPSSLGWGGMRTAHSYTWRILSVMYVLRGSSSFKSFVFALS